MNDIISWSPTSDRITLATGVLNLIRALGGYTGVRPTSVQSLFNNDKFNEERYLDRVSSSSGNAPMMFGWYNAFKVYQQSFRLQNRIYYPAACRLILSWFLRRSGRARLQCL